MTIHMPRLELNQWENFLKNQGEWQGSFAKVSLQGEILSSIPSILTLEPFEEGKAVRFQLQRFGNGGYDTAPTQDYEQEYRHLGRQVIFFETGAFSKGSIYFAPYAEFAAEYGFVDENRRLRFVQLYDREGNFESLTLIREFRSGCDAQERSPLTVPQLLGVWEGQALTAYSDWKPPQQFETCLEIRQLDDHHLEQRLCWSNPSELGEASQQVVSQAKIDGNRLLFEPESDTKQLVLLPDGGSHLVPLKLKSHQPFFVEAGWLVTDNERQRLIRHYNDRGEWTSATHVIERKVVP